MFVIMQLNLRYGLEMSCSTYYSETYKSQGSPIPDSAIFYLRRSSLSFVRSC